MNDPLDEATRALRNEVARPPVDVAATRTRLLRSVVRRERTRQLQLAAAVFLALTISNSTTWALSTGQVPRIVAGIERALGLGVSASASVSEPASVPEPASVSDTGTISGAVSETDTGAGADTGTGAVSDTIAGADTGAATDTAADTATVSATVAATRSRPRATLAPAIAGAPDETPAAARERQHFQAAHQLHFGGADPAVALRAWDGYLDAYPDGRFAPEARWNRALCLVRLRRTDQARAALTPFAEGAYEAMREREARALLDALE